MTISVVQHGSQTATITSGTSLTATVTLGASITAGNTLVAFAGIAVGNAGGVASSGFTTNGAPDNWQYIDGLVGDFNDWPFQLAMVDPRSTGGTTVVNFAATINTAATTSGSATVLVDVFEVTGLGSHAAIDAWTVNAPAPTGTSWTSGSTAAGRAPDQVVLLGSVFYGVTTANTTTTLAGPGGWSNQAMLSSSIQQGATGSANKFNMYQLSGTDVLGQAGGAPLVYSGTATQTGNFVAWGISLFNGAAPFYPAVQAVQAKTPPAQQRVNGRGHRGRVASGPGAPVLNPPGSQCPVLDQGGGLLYDEGGNVILSEGCGAPFIPASQVIRRRQPLPPRGRTASGRGAPVRNLSRGAVFVPLHWPARIRPTLPPRGRTATNPGAPVRNPVRGPVFRQAVRPARAPVPQIFSKGRTQSTPPYMQPPVTGNAVPMTIGMTLTAGGVNEWQYIGPVPLTYLQYMQPPGDVLQVNPGDTFTELGPASSRPYHLPVPPPDGRWVIIGAGGSVYDFLRRPEPEAGPDDLEWDPPPPLAHLPVPFALIAERIRRRREQSP